MGIINVLDKQTANLIAAGEVVERPSSAIKEMLENCADAGATSVTVEIKNGGTSFIRVTDNGSGMLRDDVPKCIMRHATSKIKNENDLNSISTFGFRGEALAAISSVAHVRILTKSRNESFGTLFECHFGESVTVEDAGCPQGTTITVENIFENVPARRKFLKKNSTEALSVGAVCEKFALSRPDIALNFISDNNLKLETPGDGNLKSAVYACLGREFATCVFPVDYTLDKIRVYGFIAKPEFSRPNRNMQNFFVNNRYIRSRTMMAATEEGFRGFCPTSKFPACVLFCELDLRLVDVNVHPAKLEIKFSDERIVFDAVYFAVKNALSSAVRFSGFTEEKEEKLFPEINKNNDGTNVSKLPTGNLTENFSAIASEKSDKNDNIENFPSLYKTKAPTFITEALHSADFVSFSSLESKTPTATCEETKTDNAAKNVLSKKKAEQSDVQIKITDINSDTVSTVPKNEYKLEEPSHFSKEPENTPKNETANFQVPESTPLSPPPVQDEIFPLSRLVKPIYIGEAFETYIVCQYKKSLYLIDKHAAHERIIYEKLKKNDKEKNSQYLLEPINAVLTPHEAEAVKENKQYFENIGFEFDEFGPNTFIIRSIPVPIAQSDCGDVFSFLAGKLAEGNKRSSGDIFDRALFTAACRAAIKAGDKNTDMDNRFIIDEIFNNEAVLYCPHGRPVIYEFTKQKLDKMFDRI